MDLSPIHAVTRALHKRHRDRDLAAAASWPLTDAQLLKPVIVAKDELVEGTAAQDCQLEIPFYFTLPQNPDQPAAQPSGYFGGRFRTVALSHSEASRLIPQIPEGTLVRVRYNPQDPDQNHIFATDNEGSLPVAVWSN